MIAEAYKIMGDRGFMTGSYLPNRSAVMARFMRSLCACTAARWSRFGC